MARVCEAVSAHLASGIWHPASGIWDCCVREEARGGVGMAAQSMTTTDGRHLITRDVSARNTRAQQFPGSQLEEHPPHFISSHSMQAVLSGHSAQSCV